MDSPAWHEYKGKELLPRLWLRLEQETLLLSWALITQVRASADFLSISFLCEFGLVELFSSESLKTLFSWLQLERVNYIDGRQLACRLTRPEAV